MSNSFPHSPCLFLCVGLFLVVLPFCKRKRIRGVDRASLACIMSVSQTQSQKRGIFFSLYSSHKVPGKDSNWPVLGYMSIPGPITVARRNGINVIGGNRGGGGMGGLPKKRKSYQEEAEEGTTVQTAVTGVHSQGSDSTVRLFGRESPNLEAAQGQNLKP